VSGGVKRHAHITLLVKQLVLSKAERGMPPNREAASLQPTAEYVSGGSPAGGTNRKRRTVEAFNPNDNRALKQQATEFGQPPTSSTEVKIKSEKADNAEPDSSLPSSSVRTIPAAKTPTRKRRSIEVSKQR
jgi:hypothetical protein